MTLRQPMAARSLALLTLAVVGAHLLLLAGAPMREPPRPAGMRALLTRVLNVPASQVTPAPAQQPAGREPPRSVPPRRPQAREPSPAAAAAPEPPPAVALAQQAASVAAPVTIIDGAPAAAAATSLPASPEMAFAIPGSINLRYAVAGRSRGKNWNVNGQLLWRHDGASYEARLEYSAPLLPSRSQQSTGRITAQGLAPQRFSDKSRSEQATHFDRDSGTLVFSNNAAQQLLLPGAQDRLSVFLQLASMLAAAPQKFPAGTAITLQTAGTRDSQPWAFAVEGDEVIDLPGGRVNTRKLLRAPRGEYDTRVELWLATGMDYVPVRIRLTHPNGDFVDQQWSSTDRP